MSNEKDRQPFISVRDLKKYFCLDNYKLAKAKQDISTPLMMLALISTKARYSA